MDYILQEVLDYIKVEEDSSQEIMMLVMTAVEYLKNAGCHENEDNLLYILAIKILVSHWFENREAIGKTDKLAFSLDAIMTQLKYCYE